MKRIVLVIAIIIGAINANGQYKLGMKLSELIGLEYVTDSAMVFDFNEAYDTIYLSFVDSSSCVMYKYVNNKNSASALPCNHMRKGVSMTVEMIGVDDYGRKIEKIYTFIVKDGYVVDEVSNTWAAYGVKSGHHIDFEKSTEYWVEVSGKGGFALRITNKNMSRYIDLDWFEI